MDHVPKIFMCKEFKYILITMQSHIIFSSLNEKAMLLMATHNQKHCIFINVSNLHLDAYNITPLQIKSNVKKANSAFLFQPGMCFPKP